MIEGLPDKIYLIAPDGDRLLKMAEVIERVSISPAGLYLKMNAGTFPKAVRLGPNCVRWRLSEVNAWIAELPQATR